MNDQGNSQKSIRLKGLLIVAIVVIIVLVLFLASYVAKDSIKAHTEEPVTPTHSAVTPSPTLYNQETLDAIVTAKYHELTITPTPS